MLMVSAGTPYCLVPAGGIESTRSYAESQEQIQSMFHSLNSSKIIDIHSLIHLLNMHSVQCNNNNNDRLTAFDPGQPG